MTEDGSVYSWGFGKMGALGHNSTDSVTQPRKVEGLANAIRVDCGTDHTMVLDANGKLWSFGENTYGQLGLNSDALKKVAPERMFTSASQGKVVDFSCGDEHSAYVDSRG